VRRIVSIRERRLRVACRIFEAVAYLFWVNGVIVTGVSLTREPEFLPHASVFIVLGSVALLTTKLGLCQSQIWSWLSLVVLLVPWTIAGLTVDIAHEHWLLVAGEALGLGAIVVALVLAFPSVFVNKPSEMGA
jgi:hypothetical protein